MTATLSALLKTGRLPHACVLEGGTEAARKELALELAMALVCVGEDKPCGQCDPCKKAKSGNHPDILPVEPEKGRKAISVDTIRNMRENAFVLPNESNAKVYIISPADTMQDYAQNALLKILEEPPSYATFLLLADSKSALLPTVLSRTAVFSLSPEAGAEETEAEKEEAGGLALNIVKAILTGREQNLLEAVSVFEKKYDLLPLVLEQLGLLFRDALVLSAGGERTVAGADRETKALAASLSRVRLLSMVEAVEDITTALALHANKNLTLSRLCSRLAAGEESIVRN